MTLAMPPLPSSWPYPARPAMAATERRTGITLPGLDGLWDMEAVAGLELDPAGTGLADAFGRGGVLRAGPVVLRPYRRGGLVRHVNARLYPSPARFHQEFQVHRALWQAGLPTVEPLGWAQRRRFWGCEGVFLTRFAAATPWPRTWTSPGLPAQLQTLLQALCDWGLLAPDLNATNLMIQPDGELIALDWDRAGWVPASGDRLMARYRDRLSRSLAKLGAPAELVAGLGFSEK